MQLQGRRLEGKMKCSEFKKLIFEYMENELDLETRRNCEFHILTCEDCLKYLKEFIKSVEMLRQLEEINVPAELDKKIKTGGNVKTSV